MLTVLSFTLPAWLLLRAFVLSRKKKQQTFFSAKHELVLFVFYAYVTCVVVVTTFPIPMTKYRNPELERVNLIPLVNTAKGFVAILSPAKKYMSGHLLENIVGNILLFFPLGVLLPIASKKTYSLKRIILVSFLFSFLIELIQLVSSHFGNYRSVDVDDVILNTTGAMLGFAFVSRSFLKNNKAVRKST